MLNLPPRPKPPKFGPFFWVLAVVASLYIAAIVTIITNHP